MATDPQTGARTETGTAAGGPGAAHPPPGGGESPLWADAMSATDERPELLVAGAFVGGFLLAQILKRFGRG